MGPLMYAYSSHVHRTAGTMPFELMPSRPPLEFSLRRADGDAPLADRWNQRAELVKTLDSTIQKAYGSLRRMQPRYKCDFDERIPRINSQLRAEECVDLIPTDGGKTSNKLASPVFGPYRVLANYRRTLKMDFDGVAERVSADRCVYASLSTDAPRASITTPADLADKAREGTPHAFERLLKHRAMEDETIDFLIKWVDYDTPTWTARTHVLEELVSRYAQRLRRRTGMDLNSDLNADVHA